MTSTPPDDEPDDAGIWEDLDLTQLIGMEFQLDTTRALLDETICKAMDDGLARLDHGKDNSLRGLMASADVMEMRGADLRGVDLRGEDLSGIDFEGADFTGADLRGANFIGSNLRNAVFATAKYEYAIFDGANLEGTDVEGQAHTIVQPRLRPSEF